MDKNHNHNATSPQITLAELEQKTKEMSENAVGNAKLDYEMLGRGMLKSVTRDTN